MLMLALLAAAAAPGDGKTMAVDDWDRLAIYGVSGNTAGPIFLQVHLGDLDGDGLPDDAVVKLVCSDGRLTQALYKTSPRDVATGTAGRGPRQTTSLDGTFGAAPAALSAIKPSYDVKTLKSARMTSNGGGWTMISLAHADGLCGAAQAAAAVVKSKSNITNN